MAVETWITMCAISAVVLATAGYLYLRHASHKLDEEQRRRHPAE